MPEFDDGLLDGAARRRAGLTSIQATANIWHDEALVSAAWQRLIAHLPEGSIREYAPALSSDRRGLLRRAPWAAIRGWLGRDGPTTVNSPLATMPGTLVSVVFRALPDRWRVETRADGDPETSVLVIDGRRWWSAIRERSSVGIDRAHPMRGTVLGLHAAIGAMLDPDDLLRRQLRGVSVDDAVYADRQCLRLVGATRELGDWAIWPADTYDLLLDRQFGILLRFAAVVDGAVVASADLSDLRFNGAIPDEVFLAEPPRDVRWMELDEPSVPRLSG